MSTALASSQCCWSPSRQTENLGRGVDFSLGTEGPNYYELPAPHVLPWEPSRRYLTTAPGNLPPWLPTCLLQQVGGDGPAALPHLPSHFKTQGRGPSSRTHLRWGGLNYPSGSALRPASLPWGRGPAAEGGRRLKAGWEQEDAEPDGAGEPLVFLRVIVLQADLQLHRLHKPEGGESSVGEGPGGLGDSETPGERWGLGRARSHHGAGFV